MFGSTRRTIERLTTLVTTLTKDLAEAQGKLQGMERMVTAHEATADWFRTRLTQLEHERALLIQHYMGITIKIPEVRTIVPPELTTQYPTPMMDLASAALFNDVGDTEADRLGISHAADGTVRYRE